MSRAKRFSPVYKALAAIGVVLVAGWLGLISMLGHRFYVVSGIARITVPTTTNTQLPMIACVGHGGPLETSGVYGMPIESDDAQQKVFVICRPLTRDHLLQYRTEFYGSRMPRELHAYVWLEHRPELTSLCDGSAEFVTALRSDLPPNNSDLPATWRCHQPAPHSPLGYAIAFREFFSNDSQIADLDVVPNGYPSSAASAR